MKIIVEIGTEEQKQRIANELHFIKGVTEKTSPSPEIEQLIVPVDFNGKINELEGMTSYQSVRRSHVVVAKNVALEDGGIAIVFSPILYTAEYDGHIRLFFYIHEFIHALNRGRFPQPCTKSTVMRQNILNIYGLFDEYDANRMALSLVDEMLHSKSLLFRRTMHRHLKGHIHSFIGCRYVLLR